MQKTSEEQPNLPGVSIIVPVYNVEKYIHQCVDSILAQTFINFECILVNDCSPDNCPSICDEYAKKDSRVKVIHNEKNKGASLSRKTGLDASIGNYILFIDSDDWIEPVTIEKMYFKATCNDCDIVHAGIFYNLDMEETYQNSLVLYDKISIYKQIVSYGPYSPSLCDKMIKRSVYMKVVFPVNHYLEDRFITLQSIYFAEKIEYVNEFFYHYRINSQSICESNTQTVKKNMDEYKNFMMIIDFLTEKNLISGLKWEVIYQVNSIKLAFIKNKELRKFSGEIFACLYPESTDHIFDRKNKIRFHNKILLYIWVKKSPFHIIFIDFYAFCEFGVKKIIKTIAKDRFRDKHIINNAGVNRQEGG